MSDGKPTLIQLDISHFSEKARWAPDLLRADPGPERFGVRDEAAAAKAREQIVAALDRLEAELAANGGGEFLVGESLSVADVTAASLFYPVVDPDEGPLPVGAPTPPALERFRDEIRDRPGYIWVEETFRRHRFPARSGVGVSS